MASIDIDRARVIPAINCRMGRAGTIKFVFTSGGVPYALDGFEFECYARKGNGPKLLHLTLANGLSIGGASLNELTVPFTVAATNKVGEGKYVWQLVNLTREETWLNTELNVHTGKFDSGSEVEQAVTVEVGDIVINVAITLAGFDITALTNDQKQQLADQLAPYFL